MVTKAFVDFNGIVVEKYDVTRPIDPHKVDAEYGSKQDPGASSGQQPDAQSKRKER